MTSDSVPQTVLFQDLFDKPLVAKFNQEHASSDGGAVLKAAERVYGLVIALRLLAFARTFGVRPVSGGLSGAGEDPAHPRGPGQPARLRHRVRSSRLQRCRAPRRRPHPQAAARPRPGGGRVTGLATYAFAVRERGRRGALYDMGCELVARVVERHRRRLDGRARRITIDLDPTDDPTHGAQQYSLFNGYYDNRCSRS